MASVAGFVIAALFRRDQFLVQLPEPREFRGGDQRRRLLGGQTLQQKTNFAQLLVAGQRKVRDRDRLARANIQPAFADELHDGFAHRRLADPHRHREFADPQPLAGPETPGHQGFPKLLVDARREILAIAELQTFQHQSPPFAGDFSGSDAYTSALTEEQALARGGLARDLRPVVEHRNHLAGRPGRVLVHVPGIARFARGAVEHDPAAIVPGADVENVARQRAVDRARADARRASRREHRVVVAADGRRDAVERRRLRRGKSAESGWSAAEDARRPIPRAATTRRPRRAPRAAVRPKSRLQAANVVVAQQARARSTKADSPGTRPGATRAQRTVRRRGEAASRGHRLRQGASRTAL